MAEHTAAEYQQLLEPMSGDLSPTIKRTADNAFIPNDDANRDWQAYAAWVAAGNRPAPPEPLPEIAPPEAGNVEAQLFALTERIEACEARLVLLEGRA